MQALCTPAAHSRQAPDCARPVDLHQIARALGRKVRGDHVCAPGPERAARKGWKRKRCSLTIWQGRDGDIRVHSHAGQDPIACKDYVRARAGLPAWVPHRRSAPKAPPPPLATRNAFLSESLKIGRYRKRVTADQFAVIVNDMKNALAEPHWRDRAAIYAREFGIGADDLEAALRPAWRPYSAAERARIFQITYDEYRALGLHRSGCAEVDAAERRRLTKQRYNAKRRAERHEAAKASDLTDSKVPTSAAPAARLHVARPPMAVGTVRSKPSFKQGGLSATARFSDDREQTSTSRRDRGCPHTGRRVEARGPSQVGRAVATAEGLEKGADHGTAHGGQADQASAATEATGVVTGRSDASARVAKAKRRASKARWHEAHMPLGQRLTQSNT
jgi:hypothetical protein